MTRLRDPAEIIRRRTAGAGAVLAKVLDREQHGWQDAAASAVAAPLAWVLAQRLLGHESPIFAPISAIICLAPGLPSPARQALGLMIGVATGILVGEAVLRLPDQWPALRFGLAAFLAIAVAVAYGLPAVVPIQAGVSAVLVLALGPLAAGPPRMGDVVIGSVIGLLFSQVLLTRDPIRAIDDAGADLFETLARGLARCADAVGERDPVKAESALRTLAEAQGSVAALGLAINSARQAARWSLRGRLAAHRVASAAARYDRNALYLYAAALLLGEATAAAIQAGQAAPGRLRGRIDDAAQDCAALAKDGRLSPSGRVRGAHTAAMSDAKPVVWRPSFVRVSLVEDALAAFGQPGLTTPQV